MKSAPWLTLIGCLASTAPPVSAQEKAETPMSFDSRSPASQAADPRARTGPSGDLFWVARERPALRAALSRNVAPSRDSILTGGLIGFGVGAVLGTTVGAEACLHEPRWHCAVKVGVPVAAIGALIGWLHK
jgi:hypothetical protein